MLFAAYIPVEQEVIVTVIMIAFSIFTRFWCTPTQVQSKPSSSFALRHRLPKLVYKTSAHKSGLQSKKLCHYLNQSLIMNGTLVWTAHWMAYF